MILAQLRREFAVRSLRWWIPIAALMGLWWAAMMKYGAPGVLGPVPLRGVPEGVVAATCMVWAALQIFMLNAGYSSRCSSGIDLSLPIPARSLWLSHVISVVGSALCIPLVVAAFFVAGNALSGRQTLLDPGVVSILLHASVSMLLALAVLQSPRPALSQLPVRAGYLTLAVLTVAATPILIFVLIALPRWWAALPLGGAFVLGARIYARLPRAFTIVPLEPYAADSPERAEADARSAGAGRMLWLQVSTIWRSPFGNWTWLYLAGFLLYGTILGMLVEMEGWHDHGLMLIFWNWLMLCAWIMVAHSKLFVLDPLPLSRRFIFAVFAVPAFATVLFGYGGVAAAVRLAGIPGDQISYRDVGDHRCVTVPNDVWAVAWNGVLPEYVTPWGEAVQPCCGQPLLAGIAPGAYKPFHTPRGASADLVAWQISRAVEAVYGRTIPYAEIRERYLEPSDDGGVALRAGGLSLRKDYPGLRRRGAGAALPLVFVAIGLPWLAFAAFVSRLYRGRIAKRRAGGVVAAAFLLALLSGLMTLVATGAGYVDLRFAARFAGAFVRDAYRVVPGGGLVLWGIASLLLAVAYLAVQRPFQLVEAPPIPARKSAS